MGHTVLRAGVFLPSYTAVGSPNADAVLGLARCADAAGLQHVWVGDHFVWNTGMLAPMPTLAAVAAVTSRVRLGTGVYLLNLRPPAIVAKDVATVDVLSNGRMIFGVGAGGDDPLEYEALGVDPAARGQRMDEMICAVRALLDGASSSTAGRFISLPEFTMAPNPVQKRLPVWLGGRADAVIDRAARLAEGYFPVWISARRMRQAVDQVGVVRGELDDFTFALNVFVAIGPDREQARNTVAAHLRTAYHLPFEQFERYAAYGRADDIAEFLGQYVDAGVTDIVFNLAGADRDEQLEQLMTDVLPGLGWKSANP